MFPQQPQQQFRTAGANVQIFYGDADNHNNLTRYIKTWNKPVGVSHVYMMLIGAGGSGDGTTNGGSAAVTVWYGAAQNIPDSLYLLVPAFGVVQCNTYVWTKTSTLPTTSNYLLYAASGTTGTGGSAMSANQFTASGFFQSVAGVNPSGSASTTTFLSSGATTLAANYGYTRGATSADNGYFILQPIIVGMGGGGTGRGGIGCGGGLSSAAGGQGMVLIASW